jgi:hypothetical protein
MIVGALGCEDVAGICGDFADLEPGPTCTAFCLKVAGVCEIEGFANETCAQECEAGLACERARSQECGEASEAALQCAALLECQDILDQSNGENLESYPCLPELQARDIACPET